jgi:hypothetical protein
MLLLGLQPHSACRLEALLIFMSCLLFSNRIYGDCGRTYRVEVLELRKVDIARDNGGQPLEDEDARWRDEAAFYIPDVAVGEAALQGSPLDGFSLSR